MPPPKSTPKVAPGPTGRLYATFSRYRAVLRRGWWIIVLCVSIAMAAQAWWISNQPPQYRSVAKMMVSGRMAIPEGKLYQEEAMNFLGTQVELMQSGAVRSRAEAQVQSLHPELQRAS